MDHKPETNIIRIINVVPLQPYFYMIIFFKTRSHFYSSEYYFIDLIYKNYNNLQRSSRA